MSNFTFTFYHFGIDYVYKIESIIQKYSLFYRYLKWLENLLESVENFFCKFIDYIYQVEFFELYFKEYKEIKKQGDEMNPDEELKNMILDQKEKTSKLFIEFEQLFSMNQKAFEYTMKMKKSIDENMKKIDENMKLESKRINDMQLKLEGTLNCIKDDISQKNKYRKYKTKYMKISKNSNNKDVSKLQ